MLSRKTTMRHIVPTTNAREPKSNIVRITNRGCILINQQDDSCLPSDLLCPLLERGEVSSSSRDRELEPLLKDGTPIISMPLGMTLTRARGVLLILDNNTAEFLEDDSGLLFVGVVGMCCVSYFMIEF